MGLDVVHRHEGQACCQGQTFGKGEADEKGADQARTACHRDRLDIGKGKARLSERLVVHTVYELGVLPGGDFGHDPAEAGVERHLTRNDIGEEPNSVEHGHGGIVAGGIYAENDHEIKTDRPRARQGRRRRVSPALGRLARPFRRLIYPSSRS